MKTTLRNCTTPHRLAEQCTISNRRHRPLYQNRLYIVLIFLIALSCENLFNKTCRREGDVCRTSVIAEAVHVEVSVRESMGGGSLKILPPPMTGNKPIDGKYKTGESKKYYNNPRGARITKSSHFNFQYVLGHKIVFLCVAKGNPLPQITWFKDGVELYAHKYMQLHEWTKGHKLKSKMEIDPASQADAGIYECHANNKFAVDSRAFRTTYLAEFN